MILPPSTAFRHSRFWGASARAEGDECGARGRMVQYLFEFDELVVLLCASSALLSSLWWLIVRLRSGKAVLPPQAGWYVLSGCFAGGSWSTLHAASFEEGVMLLIAATSCVAAFRWLYLHLRVGPAAWCLLGACLAGGSWSKFHVHAFDEIVLLLVSIACALMAVRWTAQRLWSASVGLANGGGVDCSACGTSVPCRARDAAVSLLLACCCYARPYSFLAGVAKIWTLGGRPGEDAATVDLEEELARLQLVIASERARAQAEKADLEANMAQVRGNASRAPPWPRRSRRSRSHRTPADNPSSPEAPPRMMMRMMTQGLSSSSTPALPTHHRSRPLRLDAVRPDG